MTTTFYDEMALIADDLLAQFGQLVSHRRDRSSFDAVDGDSSFDSALSQTLKVVWLPAQGNGFDVAIPEKSTSAIREEDRFVIASALDVSFAPEPGDLIELDGRLWIVTGSTVLAPAGKPLLFKVGLRLSHGG